MRSHSACAGAGARSSPCENSTPCSQVLYSSPEYGKASSANREIAAYITPSNPISARLSAAWSVAERVVLAMGGPTGLQPALAHIAHHVEHRRAQRFPRPALTP